MCVLAIWGFPGQTRTNPCRHPSPRGPTGQARGWKVPQSLGGGEGGGQQPGVDSQRHRNSSSEPFDINATAQHILYSKPTFSQNDNLAVQTICHSKHGLGFSTPSPPQKRAKPNGPALPLGHRASRGAEFHRQCLQGGARTVSRAPRGRMARADHSGTLARLMQAPPRCSSNRTGPGHVVGVRDQAPRPGGRLPLTRSRSPCSTPVHQFDGDRCLTRQQDG